jgi:hypothetical protein
MCPIFHDDDSEEGTFGPSMSAAMSMHRDKKDKKDKDKLSKDEHIEEAKKHLDQASGGDEHDHAEPDEDDLGGGLSSLMGDEE